MDEKFLGGKAESLLNLKANGYNIPNFVVLKHEEILDLSDKDVLDKVSEFDNEFFAIRSSASAEDGVVHSFAGVFLSKLYVRKEHLLGAIREVYHSKCSDTVKSYCKEHELESEFIKMNVIVQEMIQANVSGVAFGVNPLKPFKNEKVVSAVWGLGEGLVSGALNADEFIISSKGEIESTIQAKEKGLFFEDDKLAYANIQTEEQSLTCLNEGQLIRIAGLLDQLKEELGLVQDIEFCYQNNEFFLLQSRPITGLDKEHIIWDNSNIVESYPGITMPFTFSFILKLYESVYKNFVRILGVPEKHIGLNADVFKHMLGHIHGRVYYHLIHWYQALALLPAYQINAGFMENMMGVSEPLGVEVKQVKSSKFYNYILVVRMLFRGIRLNRRLPKLKKEFTKRVGKLIAEYKKKDYSKSSDNDIWEDFLWFKNVLVNDWFPPLANDLLAMIYFGTLQKLCKKWLDDDAIANHWIVGRHEVKSAQPAILLEQILNELKETGDLKKLQEQNNKEVWEGIKNGGFGKGGELILEYIELYGDRSVGELKIENETYTQNPEAFIDVIRSYKREPMEREKPKLVEPNIIGLSFIKRRTIKYIAKKSAEMVADRENLRFDRTLAFGMARRFLGQIADKWVEKNILRNKADIFYLKEEEIHSFFEGQLNVGDLEKIILQRKEEYKKYFEEDVLPERVHQWDGYLHIEHTEDNQQSDNKWKGIACCAGEVTANVRIVRKPDEVKSLEGDILVCTSTDPGWISIFRSASGILVERGSTLSHAAIVCREMGIPCIVAVKGLSKQLKTGDRVRMNGATGLVEKL